MGRPPALTSAQQKEATRRRAQGATLDILARSYNVGIQRASTTNTQIAGFHPLGLQPLSFECAISTLATPTLNDKDTLFK